MVRGKGGKNAILCNFSNRKENKIKMRICHKLNGWMVDLNEIKSQGYYTFGVIFAQTTE